MFCADNPMSEFKFACPVCGQHMMCDASQAGSVMDCPTCFQKIIAPQAPAADQKFILSGTKLADKKTTRDLGPAPAVIVENKFPAVALFFFLLIVVVGAGVFVFRGKIFKSSGAQTNEVVSATAPAKPKRDKPVVVAPPASDANWTLSPGTNAIPDATVAGRIHGQDFIIERASYHDGTFILREGTRGPVEFGLTMNFSGAQVEALSGKTINISTNAEKAAYVTLHWKENGAALSQSFASGYALRLEFGALAGNRLPGKIYLGAPDAEKSYLLGTFNADARKPKPKTPK